MDSLFLLLNRLNYKLFIFIIIPLTSFVLGSLHNYIQGIIFPSRAFFDGILFQLLMPYFSGVLWLVLISIYKGKSYKQNEHNPTKSKSLTDFLDVEVINFEYYSRITFLAWLLYVIPLCYKLLQ